MAGSDVISAGETGALPKESDPKAPAKTQKQTLWKRLQRRDRWPRSWWHPERPEPSKKLEASDALRQDYEQCVATVRRTMLLLLGFCLFAIVVTFGTPDSSLIASEAKITLPFVESKIEFLGFLVAAPVLLIILILYLHIFDTSRRAFESKYDLNKVTTLFTHQGRLPRLLTYLIFYWLVPVVLVAITVKALARLEWGLPLVAVTSAVTAVLIWMQIQRCSSERRLFKTLPLWVGLVVLVCAAGVAAREAFTALPGQIGCATETEEEPTLVQRTVCPYSAGLSEWHQDTLRRGLYLFRADLSKKWLADADLRNADLRSANLQDADLRGASLQGAILTEANLKDSDLRRANLQAANLSYAGLQGADLAGAELQGADLKSANLQGADLGGAELQGADLSDAEIWLAGFPSNLADQSPAPLDVAKLNMLPLTAEAKANLKKSLQARITDSDVLERVLARLRPILRDDPPRWEDEDVWRAYKARAEAPEPAELAVYLGTLACEDDNGAIAEGLAQRADEYYYSNQYINDNYGRHHLAAPIAKELLTKKSKGVLALSEEAQAFLKELAGTEIDTPSINTGLAD